MSYFHDHPPARRRQFLKRTFVFFGALAPASRFARAAQTREGAPQTPSGPPAPRGSGPQPPPAHRNTEPYATFDAHLHCPTESGKVWQWHPVTRTFEEFVSYLDRTGVQRGIINSLRSQEAKTPAEFVAGNREVARYVEKYKGRFLGAAVVNPLFIDEALREIEDCRKQLGFVWVGELCNYEVPFEYTIKEFERLVEQTVKMKMVLDVHTELEEMQYIIQKFPRATIVFPHFGDGHESSHIFKRIDLVARNANCCLDTSGRGHERMGMLEYSIQTIGADRVLFGLDFSINDPSTVIARIENSFLTEEQKRKVLSRNLQSLLQKCAA